MNVDIFPSILLNHSAVLQACLSARHGDRAMAPKGEITGSAAEYIGNSLYSASRTYSYRCDRSIKVDQVSNSLSYLLPSSLESAKIISSELGVGDIRWLYSRGAKTRFGACSVWKLTCGGAKARCSVRKMWGSVLMASGSGVKSKMRYTALELTIRVNVAVLGEWEHGAGWELDCQRGAGVVFVE